MHNAKISKDSLLTGIDREVYHSLTPDEKIIIDGIGLKRFIDVHNKTGSELSVKDVAAFLVAKRKMGDEKSFKPDSELSIFLEPYETLLKMQ